MHACTNVCMHAPLFASIEKTMKTITIIKSIVYKYKMNTMREIKKLLMNRRKASHTCDCGAVYTYQQKTRHLKTLKHQNYIKSLEQDW